MGGNKIRQGNWILTFDIGTTGNKYTIFDEKGRELFAENVPYKTLYPRKGWSEQSPEDFWQSVIIGTKRLIDKYNEDTSNVAAIGLSGHMNGCIPVDKQGNELYNDITI